MGAVLIYDFGFTIYEFMSYSVTVIDDDDAWYGCSNMSWHLMWREVEAAVSDDHKAAVRDFHDFSYEYGEYPHEKCKAVLAALETVREGVGRFSGPLDMAELLRVFGRAVVLGCGVEVG